ncbi:MAG TPA: tetratricopeptide repeat protein [Blastocatellia bacterium]|nr:tetratricopeptide repeat protein [Blastocatellia bacterium]
MRKLKVISAALACLSLALLARGEVIAQGAVGKVESAFEEAIRRHQSGDLEGAIRGYQAILATHPDRGDVRSNLGAAYARLGRYEDAITQYRQALTLDHGNQTIRYNLALAYYKAALFTEAAGELPTLIGAIAKDQPEWRAAVLLLADCQVRLGDYSKVIELLSPLETNYGNDRAFAYLLGSALISDNQIARGQVLIDRVFRGEDSAEGRLLIGSILLVADDGQGSLKEFERALELNPRLPGLQAWYGRALMRLGDIEKASVAFTRELADNPNDFEAHLYLGIVLRQNKILDQSFDHLSRAARLRPRDMYARYNLGALYTIMGKLGEAQPLLEAVAKEHPDFIEARVLLASVYYRLNRKDDGDREQAEVNRLNAERQAKQPGSQDPVAQPDPKKQAPDER